MVAGTTHTEYETPLRERYCGMDDGIVKALNRQVTIQLDSSYLYIQMAAWFDTKELGGFANWLRKQAHEEVGHALVLFNYLLDHDAGVALGRVDAKKHFFVSVRDAMGRLLLRGKFIAAGVNRILDMAAGADDDETRFLLTWFASVQLEEEAAVIDMLTRVNACRGEDGPELRRLDAELAGREFAMPELLKNRKETRYMVG